MTKSVFITGTDTDAGKTLVSTGMLNAAKSLGLSTAALKPVAAGCEDYPEGLRNADALALQNEMTLPLHYDQVNPIALKAAIAPHIAAAQENQTLDVDLLVKASEPVWAANADLTLVEGAGGWRVPLNPKQTLADWVKAMQLPVVLVVGMRLGCLNHALLTVEAIARDGLPLAGWVANQIDPDMPVFDENLATLAHRIPAPCLGHIPFLHKPSAINTAKYLDIDKLLASTVFSKKLV
jgi:dethiobiotin synthetase